MYDTIFFEANKFEFPHHAEILSRMLSVELADGESFYVTEREIGILRHDNRGEIREPLEEVRTTVRIYTMKLQLSIFIERTHTVHGLVVWYGRPDGI